MGSFLAVFGSVLICLTLTLLRYGIISGNSVWFAIYQSVGSCALLLSTFWQFHIGVIIMNSYIVIICLHTVYKNSRKDVAGRIES